MYLCVSAYGWLIMASIVGWRGYYVEALLMMIISQLSFIMTILQKISDR